MAVVGGSAVRATTADGSATQVDTAGTTGAGVPLCDAVGVVEGCAEQPGVLGLVGGAVVTVGVLMALGVRLGVRRQGVRRPDPPRRRPAIKPPGL